MQRLVASGVSEVVLVQEAVWMKADEVILAAVVAGVTANNPTAKAFHARFRDMRTFSNYLQL